MTAEGGAYLSTLGRSLEPILVTLKAWGDANTGWLAQLE
jgi:DNA-binding HxlR family transcriptional regulator